MFELCRIASMQLFMTSDPSVAEITDLLGQIIGTTKQYKKVAAGSVREMMPGALPVSYCKYIAVSVCR